MTDSVPPSRRKIWTRRILRSLWIYLGIPYLAILLLVTFSQRSLMYVPRTGPVSFTSVGGFSPGQIQDVARIAKQGRLNGWHFLANGESATDQESRDQLLEAAPWVVIVFSGNAGNRESHAPGNQDFTSLGCHVFAFDYRGYGDNPGSPSEESMQADALAVWDYVTRERGVPAEKVLIFGESLGGAVAVGLASHLCRQQTPPAGLILSCTFSSMADTGGYHYPFLPVRWVLWDEWDSVSAISSTTCPILQFHASDDEVVPLEFGRKLFQAAPDQAENGVEKRFVLLDGLGHNNIPVGMFKSELRNWLQELRPEDDSLKPTSAAAGSGS